jgi:hypothetical protein
MNMSSATLRSLITGGAIASAATLATSSAGAVPREGDAAPSASIEDADGKVKDFAAFRGRPLLIVYEDRDSAKQNEALKAELATLARGRQDSERVALAAIADVSAWDFEPAKYFVRAAIRDESKKQGTTIYCDWTGAFRSVYRMRRGVSNVVLVGRDGRVAFSAEGPLGPDQRARLLGLLRAQLEG